MATTTRNGTNGAATTPSEFMNVSADFVRENVEKAVSGYGTFATFSKDAVDAWFQSATAARKGFETLNSEAMAFSRQSVDEAVTNLKSALSAKSVEEYYALQADFAKTALDSYVAQTSKMGEVMAETMREVIEPIQGQAQTVMTAAQQQTTQTVQSA